MDELVSSGNLGNSVGFSGSSALEVSRNEESLDGSLGDSLSNVGLNDSSLGGDTRRVVGLESFGSGTLSVVEPYFETPSVSLSIRDAGERLTSGRSSRSGRRCRASTILAFGSRAQLRHRGIRRIECSQR